MNSREKFIAFIDEEIFSREDIYCENYSEQDWETIKNFWLDFKQGGNANPLTENGIKILTYMKENYENCNNAFKAKDIGEGLFISSRSVGGAMRKLVNDGFVTKTTGNPTIYSLTDKGKDF